MIFQTNSLRLGEKEYNRKMFERKGRGKMKKRASLLVLVALLFNIFSYGVAVSAETYIPKDPGNIYNDLTGNYGLLGIASQFHVFAKNKTTVNAHTDGNIATHELDAKNNFGTELHEGLLNQEINYIQKTDSFANSSGIPTGSTRMNKFVVGSNVDVALQDGHPTVNGSRLDHLTPDDFYKDRAGHEYIDFEQEFAKLNVAANDLATITPAKTYTAADFPDMNNRTIDLTDLSDTGFLLVNIDAEVLTMNTPLQIINPNDQVVVFNVINSSSALNVQSPIKYNDRSNHETEDFSDANISWNFGNEMTDLTISAPFQGTILAPNATIRITQNQDGTIIGTNVILDAATNRWDPNEIFISDNGTDTTDTSDSTVQIHLPQVIAQIHQLQATVQILPLPQVIARIHQLQATVQILPLPQVIARTHQLQVTVQILPLPQVTARTRQLQATVQILPLPQVIARIHQLQATVQILPLPQVIARTHQLQVTVQILPLPQVIARTRQLQATVRIHLPQQVIARTRQLQVTVQILPLPQVIAQIHLPLQVIARTRQLQVTVQIHPLPQVIAQIHQLQAIVQTRRLPQAIHVMQVSPSQKQVRITGRTLT